MWISMSHFTIEVDIYFTFTSRTCANASSMFDIQDTKRWSHRINVQELLHKYFFIAFFVSLTYAAPSQFFVLIFDSKYAYYIIWFLYSREKSCNYITSIKVYAIVKRFLGPWVHTNKRVKTSKRLRGLVHFFEFV